MGGWGETAKIRSQRFLKVEDPVHGEVRTIFRSSSSKKQKTFRAFRVNCDLQLEYTAEKCDNEASGLCQFWNDKVVTCRWAPNDLFNLALRFMTVEDGWRRESHCYIEE